MPREVKRYNESYLLNGAYTTRSGQKMQCRTCGQERSAVGSSSGVCKPCHNNRWRVRKGLPPLSEAEYGDVARLFRQEQEEEERQRALGLQRCLTCKNFHPTADFDIPAPIPVRVRRCFTCRMRTPAVLDLPERIKIALRELYRGDCQACGKGVSTGHPPARNIDHCHKTGVIRGVLCSRCNTGLGYLEKMEREGVDFSSYLKRTPSWRGACSEGEHPGLRGRQKT